MLAEQTGSTTKPLLYFPAMHKGSYPSETAALAATNFPQGTIQIGAPIIMKQAARMMMFHAPAGSTDNGGCLLIILSPAEANRVDLWFANHDLANATLGQAILDMQEYDATSAGGFRIFEALED